MPATNSRPNGGSTHCQTMWQKRKKYRIPASRHPRPVTVQTGVAGIQTAWRPAASQRGPQRTPTSAAWWPTGSVHPSTSPHSWQPCHAVPQLLPVVIDTAGIAVGTGVQLRLPAPLVGLMRRRLALRLLLQAWVRGARWSLTGRVLPVMRARIPEATLFALK